MNDSEDVPGPSRQANSSESTYTSHSSNYLLNTNYHEDKHIELDKSEIELQLNILKLIKIEKLRENAEDAAPFLHFGYKVGFSIIFSQFTFSYF